MEDELHFIYDEELDENTQALKSVLYQIQDPKVEKDAFVLEMFVRACATSFVRPEKMLKMQEVKKNMFMQRTPIKAQYEQTLNLSTQAEILPIPRPSTSTHIEPLQTFNVVKKLVANPPKIVPVVEEKKEEVKPQINEKILIKDKITDTVLAKAQFTDAGYQVQEPLLDEKDREVIVKVLKEKPQNVEKAWKYIQKYGAKVGIEKGHDTFIKYHVINTYFGLGKVEPLLQDLDVSSVLCDGPSQPLIVKIRDKEYKTNLSYSSAEEINSFILYLGQKTKNKVNGKTPILDTIIRNFRVHANLGSEYSNPKFVIVRM